ncbi:thiamine pyrophosphate-dependent enzyme [Azospirillum sp.]|uniref:thiamine pyrophosphate-dependent enzyme n=1 Tax=Azospirillum sp. TaxID=34012 RepID=UPI002D36488E|nr:thiamine pyrophosphate-dependent enzyme [Azospirillum sp.]HYD64111.1 thiamine pyrophosphate-dependent enzyme [Azospirillum sp.]
MNATVAVPAPRRLLLSGNEAIARAVWEAGCLVASAYPGTPSTEILESLATYDGIDAHWAVNEKVALEVAIGASLSGARAFAAMKHVGLNVASDALMSQTLAGVKGGLVIAVADDVGLSSSQNEQDSRYWGRFAHIPVLEPVDSQDAYAMAREAFAISERFEVPVLLRLTTRICHVKAVCEVGEREEHPATGFVPDANRWVLVPSTAKRRLPAFFERDKALAAFTETAPFTEVWAGSDKRVGFVSSGTAALATREAFPDAPLFRLGFSHPLPIERIRAFAKTVDTLVVVEETEPLVERELAVAGIKAHGKDILPVMGELSAPIVTRAVRALLGEAEPEAAGSAAIEVFPRPPTMCVGCPHLAPFTVLSRLRNDIIVAGDIGCYTLGAMQPWGALDTCISMGASMGTALGMAKAKAAAHEGKAILATIGDSTFLHMGMQGLLDIVYSKANITVLLLDNRAVGMTGGQDHPGTGRDIKGEEAPRVDFRKLVEALGVRPERIRVVDPHELPTLFKAITEEIEQPEPSVIITDRPCVLTDWQTLKPALKVLDDVCNGCAACLKTGCPAILTTKRERKELPNGRHRDLAWVTIDSTACTGCGLCLASCAPKAIVPAKLSEMLQ